MVSNTVRSRTLPLWICGSAVARLTIATGTRVDVREFEHAAALVDRAPRQDRAALARSALERIGGPLGAGLDDPTPFDARLLERYQGSRVLVIGQYLKQLRQLRKRFNIPLITGQTPNSEREELYKEDDDLAPAAG